MVVRRAEVENNVGEERWVIFENDEPVELWSRRWSDRDEPFPGDIYQARIVTLNPNGKSAFVDIGKKTPGFLNLSKSSRLTEGERVTVAVKRMADPGKGPVLQLTGRGETDLQSGNIPATLQGFLESRFGTLDTQKVPTGTHNTLFDLAQETQWKIPGRGRLFMHATPAGTIFDIDRAEFGGSSQSLNLAGLASVFRLVRLLGLGGLIVIDLEGAPSGRVAQQINMAVKEFVARDPESLKVLPATKFGTIEATRRRQMPSQVELQSRSPETQALALLRRLEQEGRANGGDRLVLQAQAGVYDWLAADSMGWTDAMQARLGARFALEKGSCNDVRIA